MVILVSELIYCLKEPGGTDQSGDDPISYTGMVAFYPQSDT